MLASLIVILSFPWIQVLAQTCSSSYSLRNVKLQDHVIANFSAIHTSDQCVNKCALQADCHSINYYSNQGICELNNANHLTNPESLVYSAGSLYLNYFARAVSRCSNKLCSYPLECQVDKNSEEYTCVSCQAKDKSLNFPNKTNTASVIYENLFMQLTSFTLSMWVQMNTSTHCHAPFSYATASEDNEILIEIKSTSLQMRIDDKLRQFSPVFDDEWHRICLTWTNVDGSYSMYIDGISKGQGNMKTGHVIQKGAVVLGQDQDSYMAGFVSAQSFQGTLTRVNLWDKVLTAGEISALASRCSTVEGNFIKWTDFHDKIPGSLKLACSRFCNP